MKNQNRSFMFGWYIRQAFLAVRRFIQPAAAEFYILARDLALQDSSQDIDAMGCPSRPCRAGSLQFASDPLPVERASPDGQRQEAVFNFSVVTPDSKADRPQTSSMMVLMLRAFHRPGRRLKAHPRLRAYRRPEFHQ